MQPALTSVETISDPQPSENQSSQFPDGGALEGLMPTDEGVNSVPQRLLSEVDPPSVNPTQLASAEPMLWQSASVAS